MCYRCNSLKKTANGTTIDCSTAVQENLVQLIRPPGITIFVRPCELRHHTENRFKANQVHSAFHHEVTNLIHATIISSQCQLFTSNPKLKESLKSTTTEFHRLSFRIQREHLKTSSFLLLSPCSGLTPCSELMNLLSIATTPRCFNRVLLDKLTSPNPLKLHHQ